MQAGTTIPLTSTDVPHRKEAGISRTRCLYCDATIKVNKPREGHIITCPDCGVELEITSTDPFEVDFAFAEDWQDE
jgi:lysine biosynthesis protein LysW